MNYDTLKLAEQLEHEAGFDPARAKAMVRILAEKASGNIITRGHLLVTKAETESVIQAVRSDCGSRIEKLEWKTGGSERNVGGLGGSIDQLGGKFDALRRDIRVLCWMAGATLVGVAAIWGIVISIALHFMRLD